MASMECGVLRLRARREWGKHRICWLKLFKNLFTDAVVKMSVRLIREQLSKRNLKEPTAEKQVNNSRSRTSSSESKTVNNGKTKGKGTPSVGLKRPVETSPQTGSDRLVNGRSQKVKRRKASIIHQNASVQTGEVMQVHELESSKAPAIDESLICDGDEGLPFISAVYSLASPEDRVQLSEQQMIRVTDAPRTTAQTYATPMVSVEKCDSGKNISRTMALESAPAKLVQIANKNDALPWRGDLPVVSVSGNVALVNLPSSDSNRAKHSLESRTIVTTSGEHFGSPHIKLTPSSLPGNVVTVTRNAPVVSAVPQPLKTAYSSPRGLGTSYHLRNSTAAASSKTTLESSPRVTAGTVPSTNERSHPAGPMTAGTVPSTNERSHPGGPMTAGTVTPTNGRSHPVGPMTAGTVTPTNGRSHPAGPMTAGTVPSTNERSHPAGPMTAGTVTPTNGRSHPVGPMTASDCASPIGSVPLTTASSLSGTVMMTSTCTQANTVVASGSAPQTIAAAKSPRSSAAASSPVKISPNYRQTAATTDKAKQLVLFPDSLKPVARAPMTSLVQLVKSGAPPVTSGIPIASKAPQVMTTFNETVKGPVFLPATVPQQRVLYKVSTPVNTTAGGSPQAVNPVIITGSSVNTSPNVQGQTLFQILTPEGPMLLVPVSKPNPGSGPTHFMQLPVKGNAAPPAQVRLVKTLPNTVGGSVAIVPHPGIASVAHPGILSANSHPGIHNASSQAVGLVNGGGITMQRVGITTAAVGTPVSRSTAVARVANPPLVSGQTGAPLAGSSQMSTAIYSHSHVAPKSLTNNLSASVQTPAAAVSSSKTTTTSVSFGPSPQEARIQRLKELLREQEQAVDRLRNKRQREMLNVRETTIIGRSNADGECTPESEDNAETNKFALPLPPKKMKHDTPHTKGGGKNEIDKKKADGFLPNGDDSQFVQLVGLENIVAKLKKKKREEQEAKISDANNTQ